METQAVPATQGRAFRMKAGRFARIASTHGKQAVDTWTVGESGPYEVSSMDHSRYANSNIFFTEGMSVQSSRRRSMRTPMDVAVFISSEFPQEEAR